MPKFYVIVAVVLCFFLSNAQENPKDEFGVISPSEKAFTSYAMDSTANAIVLFEKGNNYFEIIDDRIQIVKEYHIKIKILKESGFDEGNITIPLYKNDKTSEKLTEVRAITHNGNIQSNLLQSQIFTSDVSERVVLKKFTFPNIKVGCILEYSYKLVSPFIYNFQGWNFQSNIPKLYSEFNAKIPGNYVYNRSMIGNLKLETNESSIKKDCFHVPGYTKNADCEVLQYAMKNIPAFKEEDEYALASSNYISRIVFELATYYALDGTVDKYTKSWEDVDQEFRTDKDIGRQLKKIDYFEKNVPEQLLKEGDNLTKAKNIYSFIQDHFTWNGKFGIYRDIRVKEAFSEQVGNIGEINISLINLLNAAGIKSNLMLLSTRDNGLPKTIHPVISDFNYLVAKIEIDGITYLLDATDKLNPFGMLPFHCLNYYGRVMDFEKESYWYDISPIENNGVILRSQFVFDINNNSASGVFDEINNGYEAVAKRKTLDKLGNEEYLDSFENKSKGKIQIDSYELKKEESSDIKTYERFNFLMEDVSSNDIILFNPFFIKFFSKNPFTQEERNYPVDFGYKRNYIYFANILIPDGYEVKALPENIAVKLEEDKIAFSFTCNATSSQINLNLRLSLDNTTYSPDYYPALKELFKHVTNVQNNSIITLKKK